MSGRLSAVVVDAVVDAVLVGILNVWVATAQPQNKGRKTYC